MLYETGAHIYNKRMTIAQDCVKFCGRFAWQEFSCNFLDVVWVKYQDFVQLLVAFHYSNISYFKCI